MARGFVVKWDGRSGNLVDETGKNNTPFDVDCLAPGVAAEVIRSA